MRLDYKNVSFDEHSDAFCAAHLMKCRFVNDPRRPYMARAVLSFDDRMVFLKRYDLSALSGTKSWLDKVVHRCELIEHITERRTRFCMSGKLLHRISVQVQGLNRCGPTLPITSNAFAKLAKMITDAHALGIAHGDITPRNIRTKSEKIDIFDWEPILLAPGNGSIKEPVPNQIIDPRRWLGAFDLLGSGLIAKT